MTATLLTEDRVVEAVCGFLRDRGYEIVRQAAATQHGDDIVAARDGQELVIEAKGAGSSKLGTARFGREFSANQVFDHVAKALLKALRVVSAGKSRAGVALPDNVHHRREVDQVSAALLYAGIAVFWVDDSSRVRVESPWEV